MPPAHVPVDVRLYLGTIHAIGTAEARWLTTLVLDVPIETVLPTECVCALGAREPDLLPRSLVTVVLDVAADGETDGLQDPCGLGCVRFARWVFDKKEWGYKQKKKKRRTEYREMR